MEKVQFRLLKINLACSLAFLFGVGSVINMGQWPPKFTDYFMWTRHPLFFGNYSSLNRVCMCCHWRKKPKFNDVCVLFKHTNFCSRMLEIHSKRPKFQIFFPETQAFVASFFFLLHLLQSFCHILKILLKTLGASGRRVVKSSRLPAKITVYLISIGRLTLLGISLWIAFFK